MELGTRRSALTPGPSPDARERGNSSGGFGTLRPDPAVREAAKALRKSATRSERLLWEVLRDRRLQGKKFRRQHPVGRFVLDFYCAEERLAVEVDGSIHADLKEVDAERQSVLEALHIRFLRIPAELVEADLTAAVRLISGALVGSSPPSPDVGRGAGGEG
jgi:adenine-specific DNA-methyltransferase